MHVNDVEVDASASFHCPLTGKRIIGPAHREPSPATVFLLGPGGEDFDFVAPSLLPLWREVRDARPAAERSAASLLGALCERLADRDALVLFNLTTTGLASGGGATTSHVCIDFAWVPGRDQVTETDDSDVAIPAVAVIPSRLPLEALATLVADYERVAADAAEEFDALGLLVGFRDLDDGTGFVPGDGAEGEEEASRDPLARLRDGEWLAIQIHDRPLEEGTQLIDGRWYLPDAAEIERHGDRGDDCDDDAIDDDDPRRFPDETGFFAIAAGLVDGALRLRPVVVTSGMDGKENVAAAEFPESLRRRIAAYLARLF